MHPADAFSRKARIAGMIWALVLHIGRGVLLRQLALPRGTPTQQAVAGASFFVAYLLYPTLLTFVMQVQTVVWKNVTVSVTAGSLLTLLGVLLISTVASGLWLEAGLTAAALWLVWEVTLPHARSLRQLQEERNRRQGVWKHLAKLSLGQVLFLRIPRLR